MPSDAGKKDLRNSPPTRAQGTAVDMKIRLLLMDECTYGRVPQAIYLSQDNWKALRVMLANGDHPVALGPNLERTYLGVPLVLTEGEGIVDVSSRRKP